MDTQKRYTRAAETNATLASPVPPLPPPPPNIEMRTGTTLPKPRAADPTPRR